VIIGPLLGGILISEFSFTAPFLFSMFVAFLFGVFSILIVKEPRRILDMDVHSNESFEIDDERSGGSIVIVLAMIFLFSSIGGILMSLFPSYATDLGISAFEIGVIAFASSATRAITFYQATRIEARINKTGMFLLGSLALSLASLITFYGNNTLAFLTGFLIFGFGGGISYAASIASVLKWRKSSRGYAAGMFESLIGVGYLVGPLIGGFLSEFAGNAPYLFGFFLSLAVLLLQLIWKRRAPP